MVGGITLHPTGQGKNRYLTAEMSGDYEALVRLAVGPRILLVEGTPYRLYFARQSGFLCGRIVALADLRRPNRLPAAFKELR